MSISTFGRGVVYLISNYSEIYHFGFVPNFSCERSCSYQEFVQNTSIRKFLILLGYLPSLSSRLKIFVLYVFIDQMK